MTDQIKKSIKAKSVLMKRRSTRSIPSGSDAGDGTGQDDDTSDEEMTLKTGGAGFAKVMRAPVKSMPTEKKDKQDLLSPAPLQAMAERTRSRSRSAEPNADIAAARMGRRKKQAEE